MERRKDMAELRITEGNFEKEVLGADKPVLVDFWAAWCGPCQMLAPVLKDIADEYEGRAVVGKVNVDEEPSLAAKFSIASIPTMILFKNGQIVDKAVGFGSKAQINAMIDKQL